MRTILLRGLRAVLVVPVGADDQRAARDGDRVLSVRRTSGHDFTVPFGLGLVVGPACALGGRAGAFVVYRVVFL